MRGAPMPRAILTAGALMTVLYLAGTLSVLLAMPREQVSGLQGIMQAIQAMTAKLGVCRGWRRSSPRSSR